MSRLLLVSCLVIFLSGCAGIPIKNGGLAVGKNTIATMDEPCVARVISEF